MSGLGKIFSYLNWKVQIFRHARTTWNVHVYVYLGIFQFKKICFVRFVRFKIDNIGQNFIFLQNYWLKNNDVIIIFENDIFII